MITIIKNVDLLGPAGAERKSAYSSYNTNIDRGQDISTYLNSHPNWMDVYGEPFGAVPTVV